MKFGYGQKVKVVKPNDFYTGAIGLVIGYPSEPNEFKVRMILMDKLSETVVCFQQEEIEAVPRTPREVW